MIYRECRLEDKEQILVLGRAMHNESAFAYLNWSDDKASKLLSSYVNNNNCCCFVSEKDGALTGMIAGRVSEYFFGNDLILNEIVWFVDHENRGTITSVRLLKMFIDFGKKFNVAEVCIGVSTQVLMDRTDKLLTRFNFENVGGTYKLMMKG